MPERGASPFPTIEADGYRSYSTGIRGKGAEGDSMQVDWERLKEEIKPMQDQLGREHIAFYSQYDPDSDQYIYSPHGLIFSDEAVAQANGKSYLILFEVTNPESNQLNKVILINAPVSEIGHEELRIWAHGNTNSATQQNDNPSFMSNVDSGDPTPDCGDNRTWNVELQNCLYDDVIVEAEPIKEIEYEWDDIWDDDDGGGYPSQPGTDECEVAYDCSTGGGVGSDPLPEPEDCPIGQVKDADGICIDEEEDLEPCVGNPVKNPRIAPQEVSGVNGGQFGLTRSGGEQFHNGIDIENEVGSPFFAMHGGKVVSVGYEPEGIGYFVTIQSYINGEYYTHQYGHLQKDGRPANDTDVNAGTIIGVQGLSGNLGGAVDRGYTVPHTHIVIRKRIGSGWNLKNDYSAPQNPMEIMTTQFDSQGNPIPITDC